MPQRLVIGASLVTLLVLLGCKPADPADDDEFVAECQEEETDCADGEFMGCIDGAWTLVESCDDFCDPDLGCVLCEPGLAFCDGGAATQCSDDGMSTSVILDCALWQGTCEAGACVFEDPCDEGESWQNNAGCRFWAVDLDNSENQEDDAAGGQFAVAVVNMHEEASAHVVVEINDAEQGQPLALLDVDEADLEPGERVVFELPRRDVDGDSATPNVDEGPQTWLSSRAFRITSDAPIAAWQFNTLDQQYSNDASLLLPETGLGDRYTVSGYEPANTIEIGDAPGNRSYITVVGTTSGTTVEVTPSTDILAGEGVPAVQGQAGITAFTTAEFTLGPFDVLNLETMLLNENDPWPFDDPDPTGTHVRSDKPVAVFTGADLAVIAVGMDACCADHIEQQVVPFLAMSETFVVSRSAIRNELDPEPDLYRIVATSDGTDVETSLPPPNDQFEIDEGEFVEFFVDYGFVLESDARVHVTQLLASVEGEIAGLGDPALVTVPGLEHRQTRWLFSTGEGFEETHAVVSRPAGVTAWIDDVEIDQSICDGPAIDGELDGVEYEAWDCAIDEGVHIVHATADVGVMVYGYAHAAAYAYPAGMGL